MAVAENEEIVDEGAAVPPPSPAAIAEGSMKDDDDKDEEAEVDEQMDPEDMELACVLRRDTILRMRQLGLKKMIAPPEAENEPKYVCTPPPHCTCYLRSILVLTLRAHA